MPTRRHRHRHHHHHPPSLLSLLLLLSLPTTTTAIQYPIPASIFKTHSSAGNPILHIQPSFHHSSTTRSLLNFKSIFLANPALAAAEEEEVRLEKALLSDEKLFTQGVEGVQVPNFLVGGGEGVLVFESSRGEVGKRGKDTGEVWVMTFPALCGGVKDGTEKEYKVFRSGAGREDWEEISLGILKKRGLRNWTPEPRYLGRGFMVDNLLEDGRGGDGSSILSGQEKLFTFGGVCIGGDGYLGHGRDDNFSAEMWKIENSTAMTVKSEGVKRRVRREVEVRQEGGGNATVTTDLESTMASTVVSSDTMSFSSGSATDSVITSTASDTASDTASSSESSTIIAAETTTTASDSASSTISTIQTSSTQTTESSTSTKPTSTSTSTAKSSTSPPSASKSSNPDPSSHLDISISTPPNPPIPEAGFSITPLNLKKQNSTTNGMLILGGYTSTNRFVGLGQLAFFSPKSESWTFVSATLADDRITPRAGHTAIVDESAKRIIIFGGWIGNITRPAKPSMVILKIGDLENNGWEWDSFNATEEVEGSAPPDDIPLWGHAAILLDGNVMMLTSGFHVKPLDSSGKQMVNQQTWFLNLTSNQWVERYNYPLEQLPKTAVGGVTQKSHRDIALLAGVFGGVALLVVSLAVLFCYARRKEEYADISHEAGSNGYSSRDGGDKFDSMDLEYGKNAPTSTTTTIDSFSFFRRRPRTEEGLLRENIPRSPELPPPPRAPLRTYMHRNTNQPSHVDMEMVERMREQQEQRENMFQDSTAQERRRSVRSEMVAWVREWANADAAAQAAEVLKGGKQERVSSGSSRVKKEASALPGGGVKDMYLKPGRAVNNIPRSVAAATGALDPLDRCITSCSSSYSEGVVSTLEASENYTTPEELPYPVPPMLLSTCQNYGEQSPRNPRLLVGPQGVTAPLPKKMAEEFPTPTLIPRDSLTPSRYGSGNYHYSYSSTQPLLLQAQGSTCGDRESESGWRDVTPASHFFKNIPLTTSEGDEEEEEERQEQTQNNNTTTAKHGGLSLEDRIREEMYNPGPAKADDDCRLSSIMDYYTESKAPTTIPELTEGTDTEEDDYDDEGEQGYLVPRGGGIRATTFGGAQAVVKGKGKMVMVGNSASVAAAAADEPIVVRSIRMRSQGQHPEQRESVIVPLLSETIAQLREAGAGNGDGKVQKSNSRSRIPSIGSSIKKRAAAMAAQFNPQSNERHSSSIGRKNVLNKRPQTSTGSAGRQPEQSPESTLLQLPQQAEIMDINDVSGDTEALFTRGFEDRDDGSIKHINMNDKVVQLVYTAPKGKLRVVNPSPRRVSSGGTDASLRFYQQKRPGMQRRGGSSEKQQRVGEEGGVRLGSAAARKVGEMD
ncbi:hypothetical protein TWF506_004260 [Arthrobotrys conoides]|uniref:Galactose oxidase n=1 Tax=Arthrobotrys conoides TaxID=74498 RepID=A0AAN8N2F0_9PEZI